MQAANGELSLLTRETIEEILRKTRAAKMARIRYADHPMSQRGMGLAGLRFAPARTQIKSGKIGALAPKTVKVFTC